LAKDDDYIEVDAVVRMPKGERLAGSKKTEGWSRGFTLKSIGKGPEHVEIRLKGEADSPAPDTTPGEPPVIYVHDYIEPPPRQKTREQEELEEKLRLLVQLGLIRAAQWAQPRLRRLWSERVVPYIHAKREQWQERKVQRPADRQAVAATPVEESNEVSDAFRTYRANMTSDEARQHLVELLIAQHFVREKTRLLADAVIHDGAMRPELASAVHALAPKHVEEALDSILASKPTLLDDLRALIAVRRNADPLELGGDAMTEALRLTEDG
jgi:hypothetical protein